MTLKINNQTERVFGLYEPETFFFLRFAHKGSALLHNGFAGPSQAATGDYRGRADEKVKTCVYDASVPLFMFAMSLSLKSKCAEAVLQTRSEVTSSCFSAVPGRF